MIRFCLPPLLLLFTTSALAEPFLIPPKQIVAIAKSLSYKDFPTTIDILAVCRVESSYKITAINPEIGSINGASRGVMQVQGGSLEVHRNMAEGVGLLREYYKRLGGRQSAIKAYNIGIRAFKRGKAKISADNYYSQFSFRRQELIRYYSKKKL